MKTISAIALLILGFCIGAISHKLTRDYAPPIDHAEAKNEDVAVFHIMESSNPSPDTRKLWRAVIRGDGLAATKLSALFGKSFPEYGHFFERIGAENGDAVSQYNYGLRLATDTTSDLTRARGIYWLRKSAAQGNVDAKNLLENYVF